MASTTVVSSHPTLSNQAEENPTTSHFAGTIRRACNVRRSSVVSCIVRSPGFLLCDDLGDPIETRLQRRIQVSIHTVVVIVERLVVCHRLSRSTTRIALRHASSRNHRNRPQPAANKAAPYAGPSVEWMVTISVRKISAWIWRHNSLRAPPPEAPYLTHRNPISF